MLFQYKAVDSEGKQIEGTMEAKDRFDLYHNVKKNGLAVISTKEVTLGKGFSLQSLLSFFDGVKAHDKIIFARNLSKMIDAGLPIVRGLTILERQAKGKFKKILGGLNDSLSKGDTFSDAMRKYPAVFSKLFVSMVRAGEESGNLSLALQSVSMQMEKTYQLNKKIRGALMYPAVIFSLMVVIGVLMMVYMVPTLTATFVGLGIKLPLSTRIVIAISDFMKDYFLFVIVGFVVFVVGFIACLRTLRGQRIFDFVLLRIPVISEIVKQVNSARTARTLSSLISSGVDIVLAIGVTRDVLQNSYYKSILDEAEAAIQKGESVSLVFGSHEKLYPLFVSEMLSVGEETGKIGEMLMSVATFYEDEVDQKTKDMSSIVEPVLMIIIGAAVGIFAISMLGPTYSLADAL